MKFRTMIGLGLGAAGMYFFDRDKGSQRRRQLGERVQGVRQKGQETLQGGQGQGQHGDQYGHYGQQGVQGMSGMSGSGTSRSAGTTSYPTPTEAGGLGTVTTGSALDAEALAGGIAAGGMGTSATV